MRGLYIHIPFCIRKCPYCDFYSITDTTLINDYTNAVIRNIKSINLKQNEIDTIYFGGGTPSLIPAKNIHEILSAVPLSNQSEISMECNPNSVNTDYLTDIKSAGINRISFGVQSLNDKELKALGRLHDAETAVNAIENAYKAGFENLSVDLMLATPYQTFDTLTESINKLTKLPITHISAYMLKIEPNTPYYINPDIPNNIPDEDDTADMYLHTVNMLAKTGFEQYEISNFAKSGYECKHNLKYWNCEEYYGIGPNAHSYIDNMRYNCNMNVHDFIAAENAEYETTELHGGTFEEIAMLKLRLTKTGLNISEFPQQYDELLKKSQLFVKHGLMNINENTITLTPTGCLISNEIICKLIY